MKRNGLIGLLVIGSLLTGRLFSQVAKDDFATINKVYAEHPHLYMKMRYDAFKNRSSAVPLSTETGEVKRKDYVKYTKVGKIETIENEQYRLIVDHEDKNISLLGMLPVAEADKQKNADAELYPVDLEKILEICQKIEFKKVNATQNSYTLTLPGEEYDEVKMIYNAKTFFIEKLIIYYGEKQDLEDKDNGIKESPRMEITYSDYNTDPDYKNTPFTYEAFIEKRNGKLIAKPAYKSYTVQEQSFN